MQGDPAGVAAHHLEHHDPLVTGGGGVQPVEGVGGAGHGRIEAEGEGGAAEVVVDRLGHAHDRHAVLVELLGDGERAVAADADQPPDAELPQRVGRLGEQIGIDAHPLTHADEGGEPALVGGAEDRAALEEDAGGVLRRERHVGDGLDEPLIAAEEAEAVVAEPVGGLGGGPDDGVESGAVAAAGEDADRGFAGGHGAAGGVSSPVSRRR